MNDRVACVCVQSLCHQHQCDTAHNNQENEKFRNLIFGVGLQAGQTGPAANPVLIVVFQWLFLSIWLLHQVPGTPNHHIVSLYMMLLPPVHWKFYHHCWTYFNYLITRLLLLHVPALVIGICEFDVQRLDFDWKLRVVHFQSIEQCWSKYRWESRGSVIGRPTFGLLHSQ
jgi:hypothetical protein